MSVRCLMNAKVTTLGIFNVQRGPFVDVALAVLKSGCCTGEHVELQVLLTILVLLCYLNLFWMSVAPSCHRSDHSLCPFLLLLHALPARIASLVSRCEDAAKSFTYIVRTDPASPAIQLTTLEIHADLLAI